MKAHWIIGAGLVVTGLATANLVSHLGRADVVMVNEPIEVESPAPVKQIVFKDRRVGPSLVSYVVRTSHGIDSITWSGPGGDTRQDTTGRYHTWARGPFRLHDGDFLYVSAQNAGEGKITCEIWISAPPYRGEGLGRLVKRTSSFGQYASCTASQSWWRS